MTFKKVIIYGHKLHSHTHSYVHNAFYMAFTALGYDTYWLNDEDDLSSMDLTGALFLTEGQVCSRMPVVKGATYILHNCYGENLWDTINKQDVDYLKIQVYTDDALLYKTEKLEPCVFYDQPGKMLYMPWATDLLPDQISTDTNHERVNKSYWVGTMGDGVFGNNTQLAGFIRACRENNMTFEHANNLSVEENRAVIAKSYMAPAIVGGWQKEKGYIPCRIFKNISYGQFGVTNSLRVNELFNGKLIYSDNEYELFNKMKLKMDSQEYKSELIEQIKFVQDHHTYINRINTILSVL